MLIRYRLLEHIQRFPPELVILDINMGGLSGIDCCQWIRHQPVLKELPVLMFTSLTDEKMRIRSFDAGATDCLQSQQARLRLCGTWPLAKK